LTLWSHYWQAGTLPNAQAIGARAILVKAADGTIPWPQFDQAAPVVRSAGLQCWPWSYNYGIPSEAESIRGRTGLYVLDAEIEYEKLSQAEQVAWVDAMLAAKGQLTIGLACWYNPVLHPNYDYANLARLVDLWIPMVAFQTSGLAPAAAFDVWDSAGYRPTVPWVSGNGIDGPTLAGAVAEASRRYGACSVWEAVQLTTEQIAAIAALHI